MLGGGAGDGGGFAVAGVVLPEPALGVEILFPSWVQGEGAVVLIDRKRAGAGGIHADADDGVRGEVGDLVSLGEGDFDALLKAEEIIGGILTGEMMIFLIEENALVARGIIHNSATKFRAIGTIHDEGTD
jgi:hypothetical protein